MTRVLGSIAAVVVGVVLVALGLAHRGWDPSYGKFDTTFNWGTVEIFAGAVVVLVGLDDLRHGRRPAG